MSKNFLFKVLSTLVFVAVAVLWLLSEMKVIEIGLNWLLALFSGAMGVIFILKGMFKKNIGVLKSFNIFIGAGFIIAAVFALVGTFIEENLFLPIIAVILTCALLLCVLVSGGKKWDEADNQKIGYKDYNHRK